MFFYAFYGLENLNNTWDAQLTAHAKWLQLDRLTHGLKNNNFILSVNWLHKHNHTINPYIKHDVSHFLCFTGILPEAGLSFSHDDITQNIQTLTKKYLNPVIALHFHSGTIEIFVPLTAPEKIFYYTDARGIVISNDLRFLGLWSKSKLNTHGLYDLLHFRGNPVSGTVFKEIFRVPNGHFIKLPVNGNPQTGVHAELRKDIFPTDDSKAEEIVKNKLLEQLNSYPPTTGLLFSGGVDSSLLAALTKASGCQDMPLINYSFGNSDPQAELARTVAEHLKLPFIKIVHEHQTCVSVLEQLVQLYSYPFSDHAFIPSAILCHRIAEHLPDVTHILDGNGADTVFALPMHYFKLQKLYRTSDALKTWASRFYKSAQLWKYHKNFHWLGKIEDFLLPYYQSQQFPVELSWMFAKKSLNGIAYNIQPQHYNEILNELLYMYAALGEGLPDEERFGLSALIQNCCGISTAKTYDPLQYFGYTPVFPFLEYSLITRAYSMNYLKKNENGELKAVLKNILNQSLPGELIYRPKKGFIPPSADLLSMKPVRDMFHNIVFNPDNTVFQLCDQSVIRAAYRRIEAGIPVSKAMYGLLWLLLFTSVWLYQFQQRQDELNH